MAKVMNFVFGVGIAVIVFIVALLGIQAFYPSPSYDKFCKPDYYTAPAKPTATIYDCPSNMTVSDCIQVINTAEVNSPEYKARELEMQQCSTKYSEATKNYGRTFLIVAVAIGLIALIVSFFLLGIVSISAGVASAGIVLIAVGFVRGWNGTNDIVKFVAGLIVAAIIVLLTLKINKRFGSEDAPKEKTGQKARK